MVGNQTITVEGKKETDREEGTSLVAVMEWMISCETKTVRGGKITNITVWFVTQFVSRTI